MQAFAFNTRRPQFQDPRVRQAFNLAFDFEWANKNLFYDQYSRVGSYFENSELKAHRPAARAGSSRSSTRSRTRCPRRCSPTNGRTRSTHARGRAQAPEPGREAAGRGRLDPKDGVLTNAKGDELTAEFLLVQPDFERIVLPYKTAWRSWASSPRCALSTPPSISAAHDTLRLRHHRRKLPPVAFARQRAARFLGLGSRRQGRQPQRHRHQESGRSTSCRQDHLRQGSRGAGGRDARSRPRAAVEPLPRSAVAYAFDRMAHVGHVRPAGQAAVALDARSCACGGMTMRRPSASPTGGGERCAARPNDAGSTGLQR